MKPIHAAPAWASSEACERSLAVSPWDRHRVWQANFSRVSEPPFTAQMDDAARAKFSRGRLSRAVRGGLKTDVESRNSGLLGWVGGSC